MKPKMVLMAGIITCVAVLQAQSAGTRSTDGSGLVSASKESKTGATVTPSLAARLAEEQVRQWKYGDRTAISSPRKGGNNKTKPVRIITVEPRNKPVSITLPDSNEIRKHMLQDRRFNPEAYAWFDPRMVLTSWADFWVNGTDAPPVVLVLIRF